MDRQERQLREVGGAQADFAGRGGLPEGLCRWCPSAAAVALAAFVLVNTGAQLLKLGSMDPADFPESTWTSWTVSDFLTNADRPGVVFLGSSLVLVPLVGVDADFIGKRIDGTAHHHSLYFESQFKAATHKAVSTFTFALPGQMPSDAYLIANFLLHGDKKPDVIVYGLGPRDFIDSTLPSPSATDLFRKLSRFGDTAHVQEAAMPDLMLRLGWEIDRLVYLSGNRQYLGVSLARYVESLLAGAKPFVKNADGGSINLRRQLLPEYKQGELCRGEAFFRPVADPYSDTGFVDNASEYAKRYGQVRWETFVTQMGFLADLLNIARQRGMHVVVVLMPITDINQRLLSRQAYMAYCQSVRALSLAKGASLVDLEAGGSFSRQDFMDTVHLHSGGGRKLLDLLIARLASDRLVKAALNSGRQRYYAHVVHGRPGSFPGEGVKRALTDVPGPRI